MPIPMWSAANITSPSYDYTTLAVGASISASGGFKALYVGVAGDLLVYPFYNAPAVAPTPVLFVGVQAGTIMPILGIAVGTTASGTTANSLVALR